MLAEHVSGRVSGNALDGVGQERELALAIGREDDVRGVLDEIAEALLGLAQLAFQAQPLGDVAGDTVDADDLALLDLGEDVDLERSRDALTVEEVHADRVDGGGVVDDGLVAPCRGGLPAGRDLLEERAAEACLQVPAEHRRGSVGEERVQPVGVGREDHVRRGRGERTVAVFRRTQVALETISIAHVADRAVRTGELAVLVKRGDGDELGDDGGTITVLQVQPAADLLWPLLHRRRPVALGHVAG